MAPLGGYIPYAMGNTSIFQEVTSHSNTVATKWRRRKAHARLHCRLSATRCHSPLLTSMEALLPRALRLVTKRAVFSSFLGYKMVNPWHLCSIRDITSGVNFTALVCFAPSGGKINPSVISRTAPVTMG